MWGVLGFARHLLSLTRSRDERDAKIGNVPYTHRTTTSQPLAALTCNGTLHGAVPLANAIKYQPTVSVTSSPACVPLCHVSTDHTAPYRLPVAPEISQSHPATALGEP